MYLYLIYILTFGNFIICYADNNVERRSFFDEDLYNDALDPELCSMQLQYLVESGHILQFIDASFRIPRGILTLNLGDWGNYHQCLGIQTEMQEISAEQSTSSVEGKFCTMHVPLRQILPVLPSILPFQENFTNLVMQDENLLNDINNFNIFKSKLNIMLGLGEVTARNDSEPIFASWRMVLGLCIPKVCSVTQIMDTILSDVNLEYSELFCRLPRDKLFSTVDYIAMALFSFIGLLIILSTSYDLYYTVYFKRGPEEVNKLCCSFSVYTNTRRFLTFPSSPDALSCIDGIRAISMLWVVIGHNFSTTQMFLENYRDAYNWVVSFHSFWILSTPIVVDTFFLMSGLLVVYTTVGKLPRGAFIKNLHLFYLLRYLRMLPLFGAVVLLQASLLHHMSDGPFWHTMTAQISYCQKYWWSALLYVQNYVNPFNVCIGPTWYLAVDMQLYWISPLVLVWLVGGRRRVAWLALAAGLLTTLLSGSIYSYINDFPSSTVALARSNEFNDYFKRYYVNTLTRASPFFVGMMFGYLLHIFRGKKVKLAPVLIILLWLLTFAVFTFTIFIPTVITSPDYENQSLDNLINAFMRPLWATALGWCIFACVHGFGGPVNWFLSMSIWKLPARLSYAMFLLHMPVMLLVLSSTIRPTYFTVSSVVYRFFSDLVLTIIASIILTLAVDSPFNTLQKLFIGGPKSHLQPPEKIVGTKENDIENIDSTNNIPKI